MNRDNNLIFEHYRLVVEQEAAHPKQIVALIKAINNIKELSAKEKQAIIASVSQPQYIQNLMNAIEAGQNETANQQTGQAWSTADIPAQEPVPDLGDPQAPQPAGSTDLQGNPINPYSEDDVNEFLHGPGGTPNSQTSNYGN